MQPKNRKHKKEFRGKMRGLAWRGSELHHGEFGLQVLDRGWISARQIEAMRVAIVRTTKRKGRMWIRIFPQKPVTKKSDEMVRGGGKGDVDHFVSVVLPGRIVLELSGVPEDVALASLRNAGFKLPIKTKIVRKD